MVSVVGLTLEVYTSWMEGRLAPMIFLCGPHYLLQSVPVWYSDGCAENRLDDCTIDTGSAAPELE